jgi:hypothetical protein
MTGVALSGRFWAKEESEEALGFAVRNFSGVVWKVPPSRYCSSRCSLPPDEEEGLSEEDAYEDAIEWAADKALATLSCFSIWNIIYYNIVLTQGGRLSLPIKKGLFYFDPNGTIINLVKIDLYFAENMEDAE